MMLAMFLVAALAQNPPASPTAALTLDEALAQAGQRNLDLKAAQAKLAQAREITWKAWAGYLPQIGVGGSYTRNSVEAEFKFSLPTNYFIRNVGQPQGPVFDPTQPVSLDNPPGMQTPYIMFPDASNIMEMNMVIQKLNQFGAQAQVTQALIVPALWPAIRNAGLAVDIAGMSVEAARREVLFAVAQLYYGAAGLKQAIAVQERLLKMNREHEKDAKVRYEAGATTKVAFLRAELDRARTEQDLRRAQNAYAGAKIALATLLDRKEGFEVVVPAEPALPADVSGLEETALRDRPDVAVARASLALAERSHDAVFFKYLPNVVASGQYRIANVKGFTGSYDAWAVGAGLSWTLWDGGLRESELRETSAKIAEAEANRRSAEAKARDEVRRALLDLESARANREKASEQVTLAREGMDLVSASFNAGVATYVEVEDANAALAGAEIGLVGENINANLAALRVLKAAGAFAAK